MTILIRISLAIKAILMTTCADLLTSVQTVTVTTIHHLTTSLAGVVVVLHATTAAHTPASTHVVVICPYIPLPAISTMVLLRGALEGSV